MELSVGDDPVKATNDEAAECKAGAVARGYWSDEYLALLTRRAHGPALPPGPPKAPEISRGYFARVAAVHSFVHKFLAVTENRCQIVNLGCGYDTLYWRLRDTNQIVTNFIEMDFASVTTKKCQAIKKNKVLLEKITTEDGEVIIREGDLHAEGYHLIGCDLRSLTEVKRKIERTDIEYELPTLFIAECVLVYLKPEPCQNLLTWIASQFPNSILVSYEPVNLTDKFGEMMLSNLSARGCPLAGAQYCMSLETQNQRFLSTGWKHARSWDMETVWKSFPPEERQRVESIEMLDEGELLTQLFQHYCVVVAIQGDYLNEITLED